MTLENRPSKIEAAAKTQAHSDPYFSVRMDVYASGTFPSHEHQYFEILLQLSGNRTQHLGMRDIPLDEGHLICIGQGVPHSAIIHSESISLVIGFNLAFLCPELPIYAAESWSRPSVLEAAPQLLPFAAQPSMDFHCSLALTKTLQEIGSDLMTKSGSKRIGAKTYARAKLSLFLLTVVEHFEDGLVEAASSSFLSKFGSERVDELISFIQENLATHQLQKRFQITTGNDAWSSAEITLPKHAGICGHFNEGDAASLKTGNFYMEEIISPTRRCVFVGHDVSVCVSK